MACPPFTERVQCNVQNEKTGQWYDLSNLSDPVNNHKITARVRLNSSSDVDFYINICRSVVYGTTSPCPPHSGICMRIPSSGELGTRHKDRYVKIPCEPFSLYLWLHFI